MTLITATPDTLRAALGAAQPGDTVALTGVSQNLPGLSGKSWTAPGLTLDLTGAEVRDGYVSDVSGVDFVGGQYLATKAKSQGLRVNRGARLRVLGQASFEAAAGITDASGLRLIQVAGAVVEGPTFDGLRNGIQLEDVTDGRVSVSTFLRLRANGIFITRGERLEILGNTFADFFYPPGSKEHPDGVQLKDRPRFVLIDGNVFTGWLQGVFGESDDLTSTNNLFSLAFGNAHYVAGARHLYGGNHVMTRPDAKTQARFILDRAPGAILMWPNTVGGWNGKPPVTLGPTQGATP